MEKISRRREASIVSDLKRGFLTKTEIARRYGISTSTVSNIAKRNGITTARRNPWTDDEVQFLIDNYSELGARGCAMRLDKHPNYGTVSHKAKELGLSTSVGPYGRHARFRVIEGGGHVESL